MSNLTIDFSDVTFRISQLKCLFADIEGKTNGYLSELLIQGRFSTHFKLNDVDLLAFPNEQNSPISTGRLLVRHVYCIRPRAFQSTIFCICLPLYSANPDVDWLEFHCVLESSVHLLIITSFIRIFLPFHYLLHLSFNIYLDKHYNYVSSIQLYYSVDLPLMYKIHPQI